MDERKPLDIPLSERDKNVTGGASLLQISGWLWKKNQRMGWVKRYMTLNTDWLAYYEKPDHDFPLGFLNSHDIIVATPGSESDYNRRFDLITDAHVYQLLAPSPETLRAWINTTQQIIHNAKKSRRQDKRKATRARGTPKWMREFWTSKPLDGMSSKHELKFSHTFASWGGGLYDALSKDPMLMRKIVLHCSDDLNILNLLLEVLIEPVPEPAKVSRPVSRRDSKTKMSVKSPKRDIKKLPDEDKGGIMVSVRRSVTTEDVEFPSTAKKTGSGVTISRSSGHICNTSTEYITEIKKKAAKPFQIMMKIEEKKFHEDLVLLFTEAEKQIIYKWLVDDPEGIESMVRGVSSDSSIIRAFCHRILYLILAQKSLCSGGSDQSRLFAMEFARLIKKKIRDPKAKAPIKMYLEDHMSLSTMLVSPIADWNNPNSLGSFFQPKGANCIHPEIFLSLFSNVNGCHIYPRLKFLKDVMYLVVNRVENCESLMKFRNWQAWMLPLLFDIPADNSDDENTYTVLGKVRTYGLGILTVVIWHSATNPGPTALIDFAKQLRNSLALILAPCTDQSLDIANSLLSALVSRFFTDRVNLVVPSSCLPNKENVKSQEIIEELLHKWQCLLHLIRVILMVSLVVPPTVFNVNIVDNVTRQMRSLDKKNKQRSKSPAHSLRKPANSTPQGSKGSNASKDSQTSAGGSAGASAGASGGAGSTGGDPVSTSRDSKQESTSGHETWQSDVTSNLFLGLKLDSRDIPSDRVLTHMLMVVHHVQCEEESLEDSWSELTMSRFERKKERVHERSKNIRMQPEDMLAVLKRRITETKVADMPGQCGEGKIPNLGLMKKGGRGKATPLLYYGSSWKSKLKSSVDMLIKIQNLVYELKHRTKQDHLKSKALKQVMDSVFRHTAFVSDTIVFLRLLDSDLWRFLNEKKLRQLIMNFCKANDTHSRRKTFYNSQKEKEKDDKVQSKKLEKAIAEEKARADERYEILLLGPGQSGKSTIYKQLVHLHGDGFSTNDREKYRTVVYANIVGALKNIIYHATQAVERSDESVCKSDITVLKYIIQSARKNKKTDSKGTDEKTAARLKAHLENKQELEKLEKQYRNELIVAASSKEDLPAAMATRKRMAELTGKTEEESKFVKKWIDEYYDRFKYDEKLDECLGDIERQSIKSGDIIMSKRLHNAIVKVWNARASQEIYKRRAAFQVAQLDDSCVYFLNHISRILPKDRLKRSLYMDSYVPSLGDVLNCRKRTVGVINGKFTLETSSGPQTFQVIDVAGQRGARRKWIPFFNTCDCVLFVISLAGYNRYLLEQSEVLRMHEALTLFEDIVNQPQLRNTPFIVFLNKFDLFQEELKTTSITHCFPQYTRDDRLEQGSPEDVKLAVRFIRQQFMRKVSEQHRNDFYFHTTCATDTTQVEKIFSSVTDIIIQRGLAAAGLI